MFNTTDNTTTTRNWTGLVAYIGNTGGTGPYMICERCIIAAPDLGAWLLDGWQLDGSSYTRDMSHCTVYKWVTQEAANG